MRGGQQLVSRVAVTAKFHTPRRTVPQGHSAKVANHPGQQSKTPPRRLPAAAAGVPGQGAPSPPPARPRPRRQSTPPLPGRARGARPTTRPNHHGGAYRGPQQPPALPPTEFKWLAPRPHAPPSRAARQSWGPCVASAGSSARPGLGPRSLTSRGAPPSSAAAAASSL